MIRHKHKHKWFPKSAERYKEALSEINTGNNIYFVRRNLDHTESFYHVSMVFLMDKVLINNSLSVCSLDQERFIRKFLDEAGIVTDNLNSNVEDPYEDMTKEFKEFDVFLGGYTHAHNKRYSR